MQFSVLVLLAVVAAAAAQSAQPLWQAEDYEINGETSYSAHQPDVPLSRQRRGIFLLKKKLLLGAALGALKLKAGAAGVGALALAKAKYAKSKPSYGGSVSYGGGYAAGSGGSYSSW